MLPIALFYLIRFKTEAILKILVFLLCFSVFPALLYFIFGYDIILNIIIGHIGALNLNIMSDHVSADSIVAGAFLILHDPFVFGIPFIFLLVTHMVKVNNYLTRNEKLTSYIFIAYFIMLFFIFWRSWIARHWLGFIPLLIPLLVYTYNHCDEKNKMILSTGIFLLINNLLILVHDGIIMAGFYDHVKVRYWTY